MGYVKWVQSGTLLEEYRYEKSLPIRRKSRRTTRHHEIDGLSRNREFRPRSFQNFRRAQRSFRRIVRANLVRGTPPALLTLTLRQELCFRTSCEFFTAFIARLRREAGKGFRYIAVPEFQKRGAVHFHVLLWGLNHYAEKERSTRYFARLWLRGFVDAIITDGHPKIAGYLTKYMSKAMQDVRLGGEKAYYASRNCLRPVSISADTRALFKLEVIKQEVIHSGELLNEREFATLWLGRCIYKRYHIMGKVYEGSIDEKGVGNIEGEGVRNL